MKTTMRTAAVLTTALAAVAATTVPALAAAGAKATILAPTDGSTVTGTSVTVRGGYSAEASVREVRVALCKLNASDLCTAYLSNVDGTFVTSYKSLAATLSPNSQIAGSYTITGSNLDPGRYRAAAFVVTSDNPKSAPTTSTFTLQKDTTPPPTNGFITIAFGRSNWSVAAGGDCAIVPAGARTLEQNLQDLQSRGLQAQGGVILNRTDPTIRTCYQQQVLQPTWTDLTRMRESYGFTAVSQGMNYADMTKMTTDAQRFTESGATLPILNSKGFTRAWGMFNYPNNKMDADANRVVTKSFAFGRVYGTTVNTRAAVLTYPYLVKTVSVMGGRCNNKNLACYTMSVKNNQRTAPPSRLARILNPKANEWGVVQFYRVVEGSYGVMGGKDVAWDCTSTDWRNRWTSHPEIYCRNSFLEAIDGRSASATNADAAQVAVAWGRSPG